jgi:hypothetical protein
MSDRSIGKTEVASHKARGRPFKPGNPGRPPGSKNKVTQFGLHTPGCARGDVALPAKANFRNEGRACVEIPARYL